MRCRAVLLISHLVISYSLFSDPLSAEMDKVLTERDTTWKTVFSETLFSILEAEHIPVSVALFVIRDVCSGDMLDSPEEAARLVCSISSDADRALRRGVPAQALLVEERSLYRNAVAQVRSGEKVSDRELQSNSASLLRGGLALGSSKKAEKAVAKAKESKEKKEKKDKGKKK